MTQQPGQGCVAPKGLARLHDLFLRLNIHIVAGFGLIAPVLWLQTGASLSFEGVTYFTVPVAAALISIGIGEAAWHNGYHLLSVLMLALSAIPMGALGLWVMIGLLSLGTLILGSPVFWEHLPIMVRENIAGWVTLACLLAALVFLARSLQRRGRSAASTFCNILSATLLVLMILAPTIPDIVRFAHALR